MSRFFDLLFREGIDDHAQHSAEIEKQIKQIDAVKRTVNLFQNRNTVYGLKGDRLIVEGKITGACGKKKDRNTDRSKKSEEPFGSGDLTPLHNDDKHDHRKENRSQIGQTVCEQRRVKRFGNGEKKIARIDHSDRGKEEKEPQLLFIYQKAVADQQHQRETCDGTVEDGNTGVFFTDPFAAGKEKQGEKHTKICKKGLFQWMILP